VLLHPGSGSRRKRWPLERFLTLADSLDAAGSAPRFLIGPAEEDLAQAIHSHRGGKYPVMRAESLVELAGLLRSATGLVGNDAGVAHLAAFLGLSTVVIFGPADPVRWTPVGPHVSVVRPPVDCFPCFETLPQNCDGERPKCLYDTYPADVEAALHAVLKKQSGSMSASAVCRAIGPSGNGRT
jgi:ADP-heptose:LPS heptosyltransferase